MDRQCQALINTRVLAARSDVTERMAALERRVVGTIENIAESAQGTAQSIRSTVASTTDRVQRVVGATADGVRDALDVREHVRQRPWAGLGAAAVAGFLAGFVPNRSGRVGAFSAASVGPMSDLWSVVRRELVGLGETAIVAASQAAKQTVQSLTSNGFAGSHTTNGRA